MPPRRRELSHDSSERDETRRTPARNTKGSRATARRGPAKRQKTDEPLKEEINPSITDDLFSYTQEHLRKDTDRLTEVREKIEQLKADEAALVSRCEKWNEMLSPSRHRKSATHQETSETQSEPLSSPAQGAMATDTAATDIAATDTAAAGRTVTPKPNQDQPSANNTSPSHGKNKDNTTSTGDPPKDGEEDQEADESQAVRSFIKLHFEEGGLLAQARDDENASEPDSHKPMEEEG